MEFEAAISFIRAAVETGGVFIAISPPFSVDVEIDRSILRKHLTTKGEEEEFKSFAADAGRILHALFEGELETYYTEYLKEEKHSDQDSSKQREILESKVKLVKENLYTDRLQKRYDLKKSSKAPSFSQIDWDVKVKYADAKLEKLIPFPYATCRISFQREFDWSFFPFPNAFESVQINFSLDEITYLQTVLATIKERLETVERDLKKT